MKSRTKILINITKTIQRTPKRAMYLRPVHTTLDLPTLHSFIRSNPLGIFTTAIKSPNYPLLQSSHIPFVLDVPEEPSSTSPGVLRGHLARANPQTKALIEAVTKSREGKEEGEGLNGVLEEEVMLLFNGPVHHYVTPKFYTETKPSTGKVVSLFLDCWLGVVEFISYLM
jgi:transcriptional regulator